MNFETLLELMMLEQQTLDFILFLFFAFSFHFYFFFI